MCGINVPARADPGPGGSLTWQNSRLFRGRGLCGCWEEGDVLTCLAAAIPSCRQVSSVDHVPKAEGLSLVTTAWGWEGLGRCLSWLPWGHGFIILTAVV